MRKIAIMTGVVVAVVFLCVAAFTGFNAIRLTPGSNDTYTIDSRNTSGTSTFTVTPAGNVAISGTLSVTGAFSATGSRDMQLPLGSFILSDASAITASTAPGLENDDSMPNIVWADGETTPAMISFFVPTDYSSGGSFRVMATESDSTTPNQVDFDVYINTDGTAIDGSATGQTPVALAGTTSTPDLITLTVATDFASLAARDLVTFRVWRDNVADGTGDLEIKGILFNYTSAR